MPFRSLRTRIFVATLAVALVPTLLGLAGTTLLVREIVTASGTAGPWEAVAESGRDLFSEASEPAETDPELAGAVERHREALSESARLSRLYAYIGDRVLEILPAVALGVALLVLLGAFWVSRRMARSVSGPISELIEWSGRIARGEPLPEPDDAGRRGVEEFRALREALRRMADEIEASRARAVEAERLRTWTEMARRVAHELKNPLTPMRLAARRLDDVDDPGLREAGEVLETEIARLDEMARTFSRFGRLPEGPRSDVDLEELSRELARRHGAGEADVRVEAAEGLPLVKGHYDALHRAFRNLLVNALDAGGQGGGPVEITLRPGGDPDASDAVEIAVADRGPGIPEDRLERIWDPDFSTKSGGTGLGLAMVLQTVRAHDGAVDARNREGGGAVFTVRLPVGAADDRRPPPEDGAHAGEEEG